MTNPEGQIIMHSFGTPPYVGTTSDMLDTVWTGRPADAWSVLGVTVV
jgi:hypothetical protein